MMIESKQMLIDDLKLYSESVITALKHDKLLDAKDYAESLRPVLEGILKYLESSIQYEHKGREQSDIPQEEARTEADRAVLAARRAEAKAERLERAADEVKGRMKRLIKAGRNARKEASRAKKAAQKAEKAESRAQKEAKKVAEHASNANKAARNS